MTGSLTCGVDDSSGARRAAAVAAAMARRLGAGLRLVHVASPVVIGAGAVPGMRAELDAAQVEAGNALLKEIAAGLEGPAAELLVVLGEPVSGLIEVAREHDSTMIVVGSRGRGALRSAIAGSVTLGLCQAADRPVLVVPVAVEAAP